MDFYNKPEPASFLAHYGVKGMKWGVRRTPEQLGHRPKAAVEKTEKAGIIKTTVSGHSATPKQSAPNSITDHVGSDGKVDIRTFYDEEGRKTCEIHTTDHGNPKTHTAPHAHDYAWADDMSRSSKTERELTDTERKENDDIL